MPRFALAILAAAAVAAASVASDAVAVKSPRDAASGLATGVFNKGPVQGIVVAKQRRPRAQKVRLFVSLQGLPAPDPGVETYLVADTKPCSKAIDDIDVVFRGIIMANTEGDFHVF